MFKILNVIQIKYAPRGISVEVMHPIKSELKIFFTVVLSHYRYLLFMIMDSTNTI